MHRNFFVCFKHTQRVTAPAFLTNYESRHVLLVLKQFKHFGERITRLIVSEPVFLELWKIFFDFVIIFNTVNLNYKARKNILVFFKKEGVI